MIRFLIFFKELIMSSYFVLMCETKVKYYYHGSELIILGSSSTKEGSP